MVFLNNNSLFWSDPGTRELDKSRQIVFNCDTCVLEGKKTDVFRRSVADSVDAACAFSVIGKDRTLDLVAPNAADARKWSRSLASFINRQFN
jgi:hypothetical protein